MKDETVLAVENLVTSFKVSGREINAVDNCSFTVKKGKTLGIVGESGCGKSVTSLSLMRLIPNPPGKIVSGNIIFENKNLLTLSEKEMRSVRGNKISILFIQLEIKLQRFLLCIKELLEKKLEISLLKCLNL